MSHIGSVPHAGDGASSSRRIVAVLAHPDDETFIIGGTLALYAARGCDVHVIYGPFGAGEDGLPTPERLAELAAAAGVLGIAGWSFLPVGVDGSRATDVETLADDVATELHRLRPNVIITFDATGGSGNVEHMAMGAATLQAVGAQSNVSAPPRLYAAVFARRQLAASLRIGRGSRPTACGTPCARRQLAASLLTGKQQTDGVRDALHFAKASQRPTTSIDVRSVLERRREAARCYTTALAEGAWWMRRWEMLSPSLRRRLASHEVYSRLIPRMRDGEAAERDLFSEKG